MVIGRMKKFTGEISLTGQAFIMEPKKSVGEILKEKGAAVSNFVRLEVGEGIEKAAEMSFADEVAAATKRLILSVLFEKRPWPMLRSFYE